jgi:SAM-dependent methyltransferase
MPTATQLIVPDASEQYGELWGLENLRDAQRLGDFMFAQFAPFVTGHVVEIGAGIGTFSERMLALGAERMLLIEPEEACADRLAQAFAHERRVEIARQTVPGSEALAAWNGTADFVLAQNVVEHIDDDAAAIAGMGEALRPGGRLTVLVPAHPRLYGGLDQAFGHHRRYTRERLHGLADAAGLVVDSLYHFNVLGVPGWWAQSRRRAPRISSSALRAYEALLRVWRPIEQRLRLPFGLSLVLHARRPG